MNLTDFVIDEMPGKAFDEVREGLNVLIENNVEIIPFDNSVGPYLRARINPKNGTIDIRAMNRHEIKDCMIYVPIRCSRICNDKDSYLYGHSFELQGLDFCYLVRINGLSTGYTHD